MAVQTLKRNSSAAARMLGEMRIDRRGFPRSFIKIFPLFSKGIASAPRRLVGLNARSLTPGIFVSAWCPQIIPTPTGEPCSGKLPVPRVGFLVRGRFWRFAEADKVAASAAKLGSISRPGAF